MEDDLDLMGVDGEPDPPKASEPGDGAGAEPKKAKEPDEVKLSRREYEQLQKRLTESEESERYWAGLARSGNGKPKDDQPGPDDDDDPEITDDTPDKVVDEFSTKGIEALVKRGVLTKKAAREMIEKIASRVAREVVSTESRKLSADAQLVQKFPELQDDKSELFAKTSEIYRAMVKDDPALKRSPQALMLAARTAKAELAAEDKGSRDGDDDRLKRIRAQSGGRRTDYRDGEPGNLSDLQRDVIARMGIDEKEFRTQSARRAR